MEEKETLKKIRDIIQEFIDYLETNGLELDSNGDIVPKNLNKELILEIKNEE